jgi:hypothetical protein
VEHQIWCFSDVAQKFTFSVLLLLSGSWFGGTERVTAMVLNELANQFGLALGLGATGVVSFYNADNELNVDMLEHLLGSSAGIVAAMEHCC